MKKQLTRKRVIVNDIPFIVEGDIVALLDDNGEEHELDEEKIGQPKVTDVMIFVLPGWIYKSIKQLSKKKTSNTDDSLIITEKENFSSDDERSEVGENLRKRHRGRNKRQNKLKS
jgi:hypothetical protein